MKKTDKYKSEIISILGKVKKHNSEVGNYIEHYIDENQNFIVRLSNGRIKISYVMAQDQATMPSYNSEEKILNVVRTFQSDIIAQVKLPQATAKGMSFWQKILKAFGIN